MKRLDNKNKTASVAFLGETPNGKCTGHDFINLKKKKKKTFFGPKYKHMPIDGGNFLYKIKQSITKFHGPYSNNSVKPDPRV